MSDSCRQHTHLKKNFLLGILYDIINTTFLHYNQFKHVDSEIADLGLEGWQSFPNFYLGKKMLLGEVSHAPYELKRVRYNKELFPALNDVKDALIKEGMHYSSNNFHRMAVQVSLDTESNVEFQNIGPYDEKDLIGNYDQVPGEGWLFSFKLIFIRFITLTIALWLGLLSAIIIAFLEASGILPQLEQPITLFLHIGAISIYDILGPAAGIIIAFYSGRQIFRLLHKPMLATFQRDFSDRLAYGKIHDDEMDFEFRYDEDTPVNNLLKDFMKESFIFRRHHKTPSHLTADRIVHINEIFRITRKKRKQLILKYDGHFRPLNQLFRRYATLGFFSDHFIVMSLEDFDEECFTLKEIRYMHVGKYNLKFNFPPVDLIVDHGFGAIQPHLNEEGLYIIKGLVNKNPYLFNELKRKEQVTHTESLVEGDAFWLIFDPAQMTWQIKITEDWRS
ncbi:MAG: hypothetical protein ACFFC7_22695 [Candidatus Hermodarchaeota archaeon]